MDKKNLRYYYWLVIEFLKKNAKLIIVASLLSFILVIGLISLTPYIGDVVLTKKEIMGIVGQYDYNNYPEEISNKISNGLVYINEKGVYLPALSTKWEVKDNSKEFIFYLKDNLVWNDGKPFIASEIDYRFADVETIALNDKTILFKLKEPFPTFITYLTKPVVKYPLRGVAGLYRVNNIKSKYGYLKEVRLTPNKKGLPIIIYKFYDNENLLVNAYKLGEINQMYVQKKSVADTFSTWKNTSITKTVDYTKLLTLFFNFNNTALADKDNRNAFEKAFNFDDFKEIGERARGSVPPNSWAYNPTIKTTVYDKDTAEELFKKIFPGSQSATLNLISSYDYSDLTDKLVGQFSDVGLKIDVNYLTQNLPDDFDLFLGYLKIPQDPDQYYFWHSTQKSNVGNYKNLKIDKLLEDGRSNYFVGERKKVYLEFQRILNDDPPGIFLLYPYVYTIKRK